MPIGYNHLISNKRESTIIDFHRLSSTIIDYHRLSSPFIDYHRQSSTIIDYHRLSLAFINCHRLSSTIIAFHWLSSTIIDYHRLSLAFIDYHRLSSTFIDFHQLSSTIIIHRLTRALYIIFGWIGLSRQDHCFKLFLYKKLYIHYQFPSIFTHHIMNGFPATVQGDKGDCEYVSVFVFAKCDNKPCSSYVMSLCFKTRARAKPFIRK